MRKRILLSEIQVYERLTPLANGLLAAALLADPARASELDVRLPTWGLGVDPARIAADILEESPDLLGMSCSVWNVRRVREVITLLLRERPDLLVVVGGPQIPEDGLLPVPGGHLLRVHGEGELTLRQLVDQLLGGGAPHTVPGLSGWWEGEAFQTGPATFAVDVDELPSPYLSGLFPKRRYTQAILETNRGCPYTCGFCYWGMGEKKVRRFSEERVLDEIDWICREGILSVFFADANFGMFERDERFARRLADHRTRRGTPLMVSLNTAKNRPERLLTLATVLGQSQLVTTQSMAVQSVAPEALRVSGRGAIRVAAYAEAIQRLNASDLPFYVELIWPLPGETLATFGEGIDALCRLEVPSFVVYPLLALPGTPFHRNADQLGLKVEDGDGASGGDYRFVTATAQVSHAEYIEGLWLVFAVNQLHNTRALARTTKDLVSRGVAHLEILSAYARWAHDCGDDPAAELHRQAVQSTAHAEWSYWGSLARLALFSDRGTFFERIQAFARTQSWWNERTELTVELDRLLAPSLWANTRFGEWEGRHVQTRVEQGVVCAVLSAEAATELELGDTPGLGVRLDHRRGQLPMFAGQETASMDAYAYGQLQRIARLTPSLHADS